jgi:hypothetical protein
MMSGHLRKIPRRVAVDPRLGEVMPELCRAIARPPWEVAAFGPGGGDMGQPT